MMLMVEPDRSEEPGAEIQPAGQRQQPYEQDGAAAQSELLENMCPQRRRGECTSKSAHNGGGCEGSHDDPDRGLMAGPDRPSRFARELVVPLPAPAGFLDFPERPNETCPQAG
jgi:hypothetical protein